MARRKNTSQPVVLDVILAPLTESFDIIMSDTNQQWWNANDAQWTPDRTTNPLILTPKLQVFDPDTSLTYTPAKGDVRWYYLSGGSFVLITNTTEGSSYPYVVYSDGHLKVNKNVAWDQAVTLQCVYPYVDPRQAGTEHTIKKTVDLTTSRDAEVIMPTIDIKCETVQLYDPIRDQSSQFTFTAIVKEGKDDITSTSSILWYVLNKSNGVETLINATTTVDGITVPVYPCYVSGYNTPTLTLDAMFADGITVVARVVKTASPLELYPYKAIRSLMWDDINMDIIVQSDCSDGIRQTTGTMEFRTIVNVKDAVLTDAQKQEHIRFNWKRRNAANSTIIDCGWGQTTRIEGSDLRANKSNLVYTEAYLIGAAEYVTYNDEIVTYNGEPVWQRL